MLVRVLLFSLLVLLLQGCASPFTEFYHDQMGGVDISTIPEYTLLADEPQLITGRDPRADELAMLENNYVLLGYSEFNGANIDNKDAIIQGRKVHAEKVFVYSEYTGSQTTSMPLVLPNTQTSTTNMYGNVYGTGGSATYSGNVYTTTSGTQTTYIPVTVHRANYLATYWAKSMPPILGLCINELTNEERKKIGSNKGASVVVAINGSPAFNADIFQGDILLQLGSDVITDRLSYDKAIRKYSNQKIKVLIYREGKEIEKEIQLNSNPM